MAYVYKHVRLDKNEIFYIGIGSKDDYKRAYSSFSRNKWWYNITNKVEYKVEILYDNLNWEEACDKEKELIKIIGRRCDNTGTLVNITSGGEGFLNHHTEETKSKISNSLSKKKYEDIHGKNAQIERKKRSIGAKKQWEKLDEDAKNELCKKISLSQKGIPKDFKQVQCPHCLTIGGSNIMNRWHFNKCKKKV